MPLFILTAAMTLVMLATAVVGAVSPSARRALERRYRGDQGRIRRHLLLNCIIGVVWGVAAVGRLVSMVSPHR